MRETDGRSREKRGVVGREGGAHAGRVDGVGSGAIGGRNGANVEKNAAIAFHFVVGDDEGEDDGSLVLVEENEVFVLERVDEGLFFQGEEISTITGIEILFVLPDFDGKSAVEKIQYANSP